MPEIPQRVSLLAQTVDSLRRGIADGRWGGTLPPERTLCVQWNISRSTLRRAIDKIEEQGLVAEGRSGKRRRIIATPDPKTLKRGRTREARSIAWLTRQTLAEIPSVNLRIIAQLQSRLATVNCMLRVVRVPEKAMYAPEKHMAEWLQELGADVCILHIMPTEVQHWFNRHHPVACIVGSRSPGVELASIEIDSLAPLQHAVALLRRQAHRRIALIRPAQELIGEDKLEASLLALCEEPSMATVLSCPADPSSMTAQFERFFARERVLLPSALICSTPRLALFTLTWLQQKGITIPRDISLVVLRFQPILDYASPGLAHYAVHEERVVTQLLPRLLDLLQSGICATSHISIIPEYVPGKSLGPAR